MVSYGVYAVNTARCVRLNVPVTENTKADELCAVGAAVLIALFSGADMEEGSEAAAKSDAEHYCEECQSVGRAPGRAYIVRQTEGFHGVDWFR